MEQEKKRVIALAGNPNVGKSTVFNQLTGLRQHTGNWPGKTVQNASGNFEYQGIDYTLTDIPGCYSLMAHSAEEEAARDFICFEYPDMVMVVCDASCLERNLNLVLQIMEVSTKILVCVNLMDEAEKKNIVIDLDKLAEILNVPVVGTSARDRTGLEELLDKTEILCSGLDGRYTQVLLPAYLKPYIDRIEENTRLCYPGFPYQRWLAVRLLEGDESLLRSIQENCSFDKSSPEHRELQDTVEECRMTLRECGITAERLQDDITERYIAKAAKISSQVVLSPHTGYSSNDRRLDRLFTSRGTGFLIMFVLLMLVFWITLTGANYPSELLNRGFGWLEGKLWSLLRGFQVPNVICEMLVLGVYRVLAWVIAVMLPPMMIFFPLFTLLEDFGYLPRAAYNLDKCFHRCSTCGKQALTMAMGLGCNAVGVTGCRIIDSPRERLIGMLTNSFVPCNGRFPILISVLSMFFIGSGTGIKGSILSAVLLAVLITFSVFMTLLVSKILSGTILKGKASAFTLELPPYRKPQIGKVIIRSILDRTLFVLGRAVSVAAPAGLLIWLMANVTIGDQTVLSSCSSFLNPLGQLLGMDGAILLAFILGFPANEIVVPVMIMIYLSQGTLVSPDSLDGLRAVLLQNGWTWVTAVNVLLFTLMHWPCSTTCLTVRKESGSRKWTAAAFLIPTAAGLIVCFLFTSLVRIFNLN